MPFLVEICPIMPYPGTKFLKFRYSSLYEQLKIQKSGVQEFYKRSHVLMQYCIIYNTAGMANQNTEIILFNKKQNIYEYMPNKISSLRHS